MDRKSSCCSRSCGGPLTTPKKEEVKPEIGTIKEETGTGQVTKESPAAAPQVKSEDVKKEKVPEKVRVCGFGCD